GGTSAADLKFLHRVPRVRLRNFKSKSGTRVIELLVPFGFRSSCPSVPRCITNFENRALTGQAAKTVILSRRRAWLVIGRAEMRPLLALALMVGAAQLGGGTSLAQTPPSERELRIYAGLHDAAARGDAAEIERLVAEGEKPNIQDANSRTPLHVAAFLRRHAAAQALLRLGANANALDAQGYDILTIAAGNNDLDMLNIALAGGGDLPATTRPPPSTSAIAPAHRGHVP